MAAKVNKDHNTEMNECHKIWQIVTKKSTLPYMNEGGNSFWNLYEIGVAFPLSESIWHSPALNTEPLTHDQMVCIPWSHDWTSQTCVPYHGLGWLPYNGSGCSFTILKYI